MTPAKTIPFKKALIRIPTETYAYIEVEMEGTNEDIIAEYHALMRLYKGGTGLSDKEYNEWLDRYLIDQTGNADLYAQMSPEQQHIIQAIKRSVKRIEYKNNH